MAFKFKTKKRPTAAQAFAGGFAQGVSSGIQQAAQLSLQDRLNKQKEFEDFTKGLPQLINLAGLEGDEYKAAQEAQFMIRRGDIKSRDAFTSFLDGKSPGLSNRLLGATEPRIIGSPYTGYAEVRRRAGKTEVTPIIEAVEKSDKGVTPSEAREVKLATDKVKDVSGRVSELETKKANADLGLGEFTEDDQKNLDKAKEILQTATSELDTIRTRVLSGTAVDTVEDVDQYSKYIIEQ
jgi:soluble cytochrome b562